MPESLCKFPIFSFTFTFTPFSFDLPSIPDLTFEIDTACPLD